MFAFLETAGYFAIDLNYTRMQYKNTVSEHTLPYEGFLRT